MLENTYMTIFFDWGGVVADDGGDEFLSDLVKKLGASESQVKEIFNIYWPSLIRGKIAFAEFWDILRNKYDLKIDSDLTTEFERWQGINVNRDVLRVVDELRSKGYKTAVLSNIIEPCYDLLIQSGLYDHFDEVIASCKVGYSKPEKEIYELALRELNTTAEQAVFIDDRQWNLDRADELGFTSILAINPEQIISDLNALISRESSKLIH
jgi:epoxide hydrolase-like predicted phosphatase